MRAHYDLDDLLPLGAFRKEGGRMRLFKKDQKAPDYKPMAEASKETAQIMAKLGNDQLDVAKQQYNDSLPLFESLVSQQLDISNTAAAQGKDYDAYQKTFRPVEQQMLGEAMQGNQAEVDAYDAANKADAAAITADPTSVYNSNKGAIDAQVGRAVADTNNGYTRSVNQAIRQGMRYGAGINGIVSNVGGMGMAQAQAQAAAANGTREMGINDARNRTAMGLQLRQGNMAAKNSQDAIGWAKKLDAAGLVKGLTGASQGAYGLAINAGNAAGANQQAPGQQQMNGMAQGSNTIASGRSMYQSGLGAILNSQTQMAANDQSGATGGAVVGALGSMGAAFI